MERDHQRNPQRSRNRQRKRAAAAEMRVDEPRPQCSEIGHRRQHAEMLEQNAVEAAANAAAAEQQRLDPEIGEPVAAMPPDPDRRQMLEPDIEPAQEMHLRPRHDAVAVHQDRFATGPPPLRAGPIRSVPQPISASYRAATSSQLSPRWRASASL